MLKKIREGSSVRVFRFKIFIFFLHKEHMEHLIKIKFKFKYSQVIREEVEQSRSH